MLPPTNVWFLQFQRTKFGALIIRDSASNEQIKTLNGLKDRQEISVGSIPSRVTCLEDKVIQLTAQLAEMNKKFEAKTARIPVAPNLIKNSLLREVDISTSIPTGFSLNTFRTGGSMNFAAVHPYCQGFEGCYTETAPNNSVTPEKCAEAGADRPVWYGRYNMGPRLTRGGLSTGWATITDGHLLKLKGTRIDKHETTVNMPCIEAGAATLVRFTAWIKCVKGAVQFSVDYPFWDNPSGLLEGERKNGLCRAQDCVGSPQGKASYWRLRSDHSQKKLKVGSKNFFEIVAFINIILIDRVFWSLGRMVAFFKEKFHACSF